MFVDTCQRLVIGRMSPNRHCQSTEGNEALTSTNRLASPFFILH